MISPTTNFQNRGKKHCAALSIASLLFFQPVVSNGTDVRIPSSVENIISTRDSQDHQSKRSISRHARLDEALRWSDLVEASDREAGTRKRLRKRLQKRERSSSLESNNLHRQMQNFNPTCKGVLLEAGGSLNSNEYLCYSMLRFGIDDQGRLLLGFSESQSDPLPVDIVWKAIPTSMDVEPSREFSRLELSDSGSILGYDRNGFLIFDSNYDYDNRIESKESDSVLGFSAYCGDAESIPEGELCVRLISPAIPGMPYGVITWGVEVDPDFDLIIDAPPVSLPLPQPDSLMNYPSYFPTYFPTQIHTANPSGSPTPIPTTRPTPIPTTRPTPTPTTRPTPTPTTRPTPIPTIYPTSIPTIYPTSIPTIHPTSIPTIHPTSIPTTRPTRTPSMAPYRNQIIPPTKGPSHQPIDDPPMMPAPAVHSSYSPSFAPLTYVADDSIIWGNVWLDSNLDGIMDVEEEAMGNFEVKLFECLGDESAVMIDIAFTDPHGMYFFQVPHGRNYKIRFEADTSNFGYSYGTDSDVDDLDFGWTDCQTPEITSPIEWNAGLFVTDSANSSEHSITAGESITEDESTNMDIGLGPPVNDIGMNNPIAEVNLSVSTSIGGSLFLDLNENGLIDPVEDMAVIEGYTVEGAAVKVSLIDCNSDSLFALIEASFPGIYLFEGLVEGDYRVKFDLVAVSNHNKTNVTGPLPFSFIDYNNTNGSLTSIETGCINLSNGEESDSINAAIRPISASVTSKSAGNDFVGEISAAAPNEIDSSIDANNFPEEQKPLNKNVLRSNTAQTDGDTNDSENKRKKPFIPWMVSAIVIVTVVTVASYIILKKRANQNQSSLASSRGLSENLKYDKDINSLESLEKSGPSGVSTVPVGPDAVVLYNQEQNDDGIVSYYDDRSDPDFDSSDESENLDDDEGDEDRDSSEKNERKKPVQLDQNRYQHPYHNSSNSSAEWSDESTEMTYDEPQSHSQSTVITSLQLEEQTNNEDYVFDSGDEIQDAQQNQSENSIIPEQQIHYHREEEGHAYYGDDSESGFEPTDTTGYEYSNQPQYPALYSNMPSDFDSSADELLKSDKNSTMKLTYLASTPGAVQSDQNQQPYNKHYPANADQVHPSQVNYYDPQTALQWDETSNSPHETGTAVPYAQGYQYEYQCHHPDNGYYGGTPSNYGNPQYVTPPVDSSRLSSDPPAASYRHLSTYQSEELDGSTSDYNAWSTGFYQSKGQVNEFGMPGHCLASNESGDLANNGYHRHSSAESFGSESSESDSSESDFTESTGSGWSTSSYNSSTTGETGNSSKSGSNVSSKPKPRPYNPLYDRKSGASGRRQAGSASLEGVIPEDSAVEYESYTVPSESSFLQPTDDKSVLSAGSDQSADPPGASYKALRHIPPPPPRPPQPQRR